MKKILLIALVLSAALLSVSKITAEEEEKALNFTSSVTNKEDSIEFDISDDYANQHPSVQLDCNIGNAVVYAPDGSLISSTLSSGTITFTVSKGGGTYTIKAGSSSADSSRRESRAVGTYKVPKTGIE